MRNKRGVLIARRVQATVVLRDSAAELPNACRLVQAEFEKDASGGPLTYAGMKGETWFPCVNATE